MRNYLTCLYVVLDLLSVKLLFYLQQRTGEYWIQNPSWTTVPGIYRKPCTRGTALRYHLFTVFKFCNVLLLRENYSLFFVAFSCKIFDPKLIFCYWHIKIWPVWKYKRQKWISLAPSFYIFWEKHALYKQFSSLHKRKTYIYVRYQILSFLTHWCSNKPKYKLIYIIGCNILCIACGRKFMD